MSGAKHTAATAINEMREREIKCVNALEGIPDPAAFREVFGELVEALDVAVAALKCTQAGKYPTDEGLPHIDVWSATASSTLAKAKELTQ